MAVAGEILMLPFFGQGHLFPSIELCKHLSSRTFQTTLIISSALSPSIPSTLPHRHPLIRISEIPCSAAPPPPPPEASASTEGPPSGDPFGRQHGQMGLGIESLLSGRPEGSPRPVCAVIDVMMSWSKEIFAKFGIPTVAFFTSGACSAAMEYATWMAGVDELKPGDTRQLPGLPDDMAVSYFDLQHQHPPCGRHGAPGFGPPGGPPPMSRGFGADGPPPFGPGGPPAFGPGGPPAFGPGSGPPGSTKPSGKNFRGPPKPGSEPMWLHEVEGTIGLMMNTSHDLEGPFLDYVGQQMGKSVWGVGPLLPEQYWNSAGSVLHDRDIRPKKQSSHSEEEVIQWLDAKPQGSVLYISFGSEVGPSEKEYAELASALEESDKTFIWVVRPGSGRPGPPPEKGDEGYYPHGLEAKAGERGLIIRGWAPQLLILSHPSTGGFLTHCGWNSTVEAIGRGVPMLAWPIRGDQFYNAKLVVSHLKLGHRVKETDMSEMVKKDDIVKGIGKLMGDQGAKTRAMAIREKFVSGFPATSEVALDAFKNFVGAKTE
uniref:Glycosyltransferase n=1 Tax=Fallopia multiflora TaxID=76025 RepID=A0A9E7V1Q5_9CARY|nr:UDP-glycosyltransferase [Fallopia multiflora]